MSFPSLPLRPWDLCWMCWIRWRDVGVVGSATRSRERFFEPPERRTAAMRIAMRPLEFSVDFFPPKKGRFGGFGGKNLGSPQIGHMCVNRKKRDDCWRWYCYLNLSWKVFCSSCWYFWLTVWKGFMGVWGHNFETYKKIIQNPLHIGTTCYLVTLHVLHSKVCYLIREPCESTPVSCLSNVYQEYSVHHHKFDRRETWFEVKPEIAPE